MEEIKNSVCNIVIDNSYRYFDLPKEYDNVLIITDQNVYNHQINKFITNLKCEMIYEYIIPPGEDSKSLEVYEEIMRYCIRINLSRKSVIIALGGGVVGDLAGFIASTYMRGIDVVQVPTSLLAQVDSSVGGKTAINLGNFKNIIGTFYQPIYTYINIESLKTLPEEEFIDGISEVIKYSIIYDYDFFDYLNKNSEYILNRDNDCLSYIVSKCIRIKADIVEKDEKELSLRKILNLGHTFGHGVEKLGMMSHGKAIGIGMNMAFNLALEEGLIEKEYYEEFLNICKKYNIELKYDDLNEEEIIKVMKMDKKNSFGNIGLILPTSRGKVKIIEYISEEKILNTIKRCKNA